MASAISFVKATAVATGAAAAAGAAAPGAGASSAQRVAARPNSIKTIRAVAMNSLVLNRVSMFCLLSAPSHAIVGFRRSAFRSILTRRWPLPLELIDQLKRDRVLRASVELPIAVIEDLRGIRRLVVPVLHAGKEVIEEFISAGQRELPDVEWLSSVGIERKPKAVFVRKILASNAYGELVGNIVYRVSRNRVPGGCRRSNSECLLFGTMVIVDGEGQGRDGLIRDEEVKQRSFRTSPVGLLSSPGTPENHGQIFQGRDRRHPVKRFSIIVVVGVVPPVDDPAC